MEEYYLKGRLGLEFVDAYILFNSFPLERLGNLVVSGSLSGQINFNGLVAEPDMDIKIILEKGSLNADKVGFQSHLVINEDLFTLESLSFSYRDNRLANGSGIIDKRNGQFQFNSYYFGNFFNNDIVSNLFFEGIIKDIEDGSFFNLFDKEIEGTLNVSNITVEDEKYKSWNIRMSKMRDSLHITGGPDNVINFSLYEAEKFKIQIGSPFPVQCKASGLIKGKTIDAIIEEIQIDMGIFNLMLGINIIQFKSGIAYGKELTISGYINDPDFEGYMKVNDVRLAFFLSKDDSEPFDTNLIFHEKTFRMGETKLLVGNGILWANKGIFYLDHWMPAAFDLEFRSDNNVGLHCVYDFGPVFVDGYAVGSVSTHGNRTTIWVDGNIEAKYCAITLSDTVKTGESGDFGMNLIVNINFVSGRKVEFLWPTQAFPVLKCYSKQDSKLDISYNSDEGAFSMNGSVGIKGGEVFYFNRNFYLKEGNILFNIFNPESIDPRISIRAEMREIDEDGELVYIYLVANNNILSEFSPRFESSPVMTEEEIFRLLGRSITERIEERGLGLSVFLLSTEVITEVGFFRSFEQTVRDIFGLDLFSIRTQLIENVLLDKIVDSTEQEEVDNRVSLGKYLDNTTITFGQNLGDDLLLSGLVRLKEVDYYSPETVMESGFFGVEPEFEISIDWPTPFFNLEWTFNLAQEHLNDLYFYLTDNTIKFTWNFTY